MLKQFHYHYLNLLRIVLVISAQEGKFAFSHYSSAFSKGFNYKKVYKINLIYSSIIEHKRKSPFSCKFTKF